MVTIVITTCKREVSIVKRAIDSVIAQTYKDWELIVVDDSPDTFDNRSLVKDCVNQLSQQYNVVYIPNAVNSGACYSRNVGLQAAKGEYIAYLDDDDEWLPEKLDNQIKAFMQATPFTALVYSPFIFYNESTDVCTKRTIPPRNGRLYDELMKNGNFVGGMSMPMMKTECVRAVDGFDELMQSAQDFDLWLRLAERYEILFLPDYNVIYHIHNGEQITSNPKKKIAGLERLCEKNKVYLLSHKKV